MRAWVVLGLLNAAAGCGTTEPSPVPVGQTFEVAVGQTQPVGDELRITFQGVSEDSRCPSDVNCVWEGDAVLEVSVRSSSGTVGGQLHTSGSRGGPLRVGRFEIQVRDLRPVPVSTRTIDPKDYVATLVVVEGGQ